MSATTTVSTWEMMAAAATKDLIGVKIDPRQISVPSTAISVGSLADNVQRYFRESDYRILNVGNERQRGVGGSRTVAVRRGREKWVLNIVEDNGQTCIRVVQHIPAET